MTGNRKVTLFNLISEDGTVVMYNVTAQISERIDIEKSNELQ